MPSSLLLVKTTNPSHTSIFNVENNAKICKSKSSNLPKEAKLCLDHSSMENMYPSKSFFYVYNHNSNPANLSFECCYIQLMKQANPNGNISAQTQQNSTKLET